MSVSNELNFMELQFSHFQKTGQSIQSQHLIKMPKISRRESGVRVILRDKRAGPAIETTFFFAGYDGIVLRTAI